MLMMYIFRAKQKVVIAPVFNTWRQSLAFNSLKGRVLDINIISTGAPRSVSSNYSRQCAQSSFANFLFGLALIRKYSFYQKTAWQVLDSSNEHFIDFLRRR